MAALALAPLALAQPLTVRVRWVRCVQVKALQYNEKHGEVCPADWKPGAPSMKGDPEGSKGTVYTHILSPALSLSLSLSLCGRLLIACGRPVQRTSTKCSRTNFWWLALAIRLFYLACRAARAVEERS
jgi:hypothetical protein